MSIVEFLGDLGLVLLTVGVGSAAILAFLVFVIHILARITPQEPYDTSSNAEKQEQRRRLESEIERHTWFQP
jgi:hypothetical protein